MIKANILEDKNNNIRSNSHNKNNINNIERNKNIKDSTKNKIKNNIYFTFFKLKIKFKII